MGLDPLVGRRVGVAGSRGTSEEDDLYERIAENPTYRIDHLMCRVISWKIVGYSGAFCQLLGSQSVDVNQL